jgi:hypothetical protein
MIVGAKRRFAFSPIAGPWDVFCFMSRLHPDPVQDLRAGLFVIRQIPSDAITARRAGINGLTARKPSTGLMAWMAADSGTPGMDRRSAAR